MTRQRRLILELMQQSPRHLTADEIFAQARTRMPNIARGTVYRNLKLMEQAGEIARLEMPDGADRFDKTAAPHGHLYCDGCGELQDIPVVGLVREIENVIGTEVRSYQLTIHYLCPACRAKAAHCPFAFIVCAQPRRANRVFARGAAWFFGVSLTQAGP